MSFSHPQATATATDFSGLASLSAVLASNPSKGDLIVVGVTWFNGSTTPPASISVSDSNGNAYTKTPNSPSSVNAATVGFQYLFYLANAPSNASKTITLSCSASSASLVNVDDFAVVGGSVSLDLDTAGSGTGATVNTPTVSVTSTNELLYSYAQGVNAITAVNSPWTLGSVASGASGYILSASANTALNMTHSASGWASIGASFRQMPTARQIAVRQAVNRASTF